MDSKNTSIVLIAGLVAMSIATIVVTIASAPQFPLPTISYIAEQPTEYSGDFDSEMTENNVFTTEELEELKQTANDTLLDYDYKIEDYEKTKTKAINVEPDFPIDINNASQKDLEFIPNIGPKTAQSILAYKGLCGGKIASIEELICIKGVGEKTIEVLSEYLYV